MEEEEEWQFAPFRSASTFLKVMMGNTRLEQLREAFGLDDSEELYGSYNCAHTVPKWTARFLQGQLYVFSSCMVFHANLMALSKVDCIIHFKDVRVIRKRTLMRMHNTIAVRSEGPDGRVHDDLFTSFVFKNRRKAYDAMVARWRQISPAAANSYLDPFGKREMSASPCSDIASESDDIVQHVHHHARPSHQRRGSSASRRGSLGADHEFGSLSLSGSGSVQAVSAFPVWPPAVDARLVPAVNEQDMTAIMDCEVPGVDVKSFAEVLLSDVSGFFPAASLAQGHKLEHLSQWQLAPPSHHLAPPGSLTRTFKYIYSKPGNWGTVTSQVIQEQVLMVTPEGKLLFLIRQRVPDLPAGAGKCFHIDVRWEVSPLAAAPAAAAVPGSATADPAAHPTAVDRRPVTPVSPGMQALAAAAAVAAEIGSTPTAAAAAGDSADQTAAAAAAAPVPMFNALLSSYNANAGSEAAAANSGSSNGSGSSSGPVRKHSTGGESYSSTAAAAPSAAADSRTPSKVITETASALKQSIKGKVKGKVKELKSRVSSSSSVISQSPMTSRDLGLMSSNMSYDGYDNISNSSNITAGVTQEGMGNGPKTHNRTKSAGSDGNSAHQAHQGSSSSSSSSGLGSGASAAGGQPCTAADLVADAVQSAAAMAAAAAPSRSPAAPTAPPTAGPGLEPLLDRSNHSSYSSRLSGSSSPVDGQQQPLLPDISLMVPADVAAAAAAAAAAAGTPRSVTSGPAQVDYAITGGPRSVGGTSSDSDMVTDGPAVLGTPSGSSFFSAGLMGPEVTNADPALSAAAAAGGLDSQQQGLRSDSFQNLSRDSAAAATPAAAADTDAGVIDAPSTDVSHQRDQMPANPAAAAAAAGLPDLKLAAQKASAAAAAALAGADGDTSVTMHPSIGQTPAAAAAGVRWRVLLQVEITKYHIAQGKIKADTTAAASDAMQQNIGLAKRWLADEKVRQPLADVMPQAAAVAAAMAAARKRRQGHALPRVYSKRFAPNYTTGYASPVTSPSTTAVGQQQQQAVDLNPINTTGTAHVPLPVAIARSVISVGLEYVRILWQGLGLKDVPLGLGLLLGFVIFVQVMLMWKVVGLQGRVVELLEVQQQWQQQQMLLSAVGSESGAI